MPNSSVPPPLPYILYVDELVMQPAPDNRIERRKTAVDVEMGKDKVEELIRALSKGIERDLPGTIRFRLIGRIFV